MALAAVMGACGGEPAAPDLPPEPVGSILGQLHAPGATSFSGLTARVTWGEQSESVSVQPDGSFTIPLFTDVSGFGALTIEPDANTGVHAAYVLLTPGDLDGRGQIALVPDRWTLESGDYAGTEVPIDPDLAADSKVMPSFWGFFFPFRQQGSFQVVTNSALWAGDLRTWKPGLFPIPVALDRPGSNAGITEADSIAFWSHVETMESALGRDVFEPAAIDDVTILGGSRRARNAVLVQIDTAQLLDGYSDPNTPDAWTWLFSADASSWSGSPVSRVALGSADMNGARVRLRSTELLTDRRTVIHELMHVLGAGHGCSWASVQTYCASLATDVPTPADVAHLEVLEAMRGLEATINSRWGIMSAVLGQRTVTLGLPAIPPPDVVWGPGRTPDIGR